MELQQHAKATTNTAPQRALPPNNSKLNSSEPHAPTEKGGDRVLVLQRHIRLLAMSSNDSASSSAADSDDRRLALRQKITHDTSDAQHDDEKMNDEEAAAELAQNIDPLAALAAGPSSPILPLPARALDRILDALSISDLLQCCVVARSWYSSCVHYSKTATAAAVSRPTVYLKTPSNLQLLLASNLRGIVTAINCMRFVNDVLDSASFISVVPDMSIVDSAPRTLPSLHTLQIHIGSLRSAVDVEFPSTLTDLNLALSFHTSSTKRGVPVEEGKPPPSWTSEECDDFAERAVQSAAKLPKLRSFFLSTPQASSCSHASPAFYWLDPLRDAPMLEHLGFDFEGFRPYAQIRAMPHLRQLIVPSQRENAWRDSIPKLLAPPHNLRLTSLPLRTAEISKESVPFLLTLSHSLASLAPRHWDLIDLSWLSQMRVLSRLSFREYTYSSGINPSVASIVGLLPRMPQITSLTIAFPTFDSEHLEVVLESLPVLAQLELESKAIQSLAPFAWHATLTRSMTDLKLCCPRLPRDEISSLLCLLELKRLDIAGSFSEPLYARQLAPFEPPYPKSPLHWLRSFTPRSEREPVPSPPVDKAAVAAAHAAFDARVRAGEVAAAELLNAGQLSGVFRFLSCRDFSLAARSCRSWRTAASLPSAWGFATPPSSSHEVAPVSPGWTLSLFHLLGHGVDLLQPLDDRLLSFTDQSPELSTDIMPHLMLWRNARGLQLQLNPQPGFSAYWSDGLVAAQRFAHEAPLRALPCLSRLEALVVDWSPYTRHTAGIVAALAAVGPRLMRAEMSALPRECWDSLTNLQSLYYHWNHSSVPDAPNRAPDLAAMSRMHSLHTLVLRSWGGLDCPGLGATLRALSVHHSLRHLSLELKTSDKSISSATALWPLETVLSELTGISCMSSAPAEAAATDEPERKEGSVEQTLAAMAASACPSQSSAAAAAATDAAIFPPPGPSSLLESFSLLVGENVKLSATASFPFAAVVLGLPRLKRLQLTVLIPQAAADLSSLDRVASFFPDRTPNLESLCLGIEVAWSSFEALKIFSRLTALRLMDSRACRNPEALSIHTSNMKLNPGTLPTLARCMPRLSLLVLDGVEVPSGDLGCLSSLAALKSLRLFRQDALQLADLDVLMECPRLEELTLARLDRVPLQSRTWMALHGRQLSAEEAADSNMLAAYDKWRGAGVKKHKNTFNSDSDGEEEGDNENENEAAAEQQEEKKQTETKEEEEAVENDLAAPPASAAPAAASAASLFGDAMMDDAPPAAATTVAPAAAPAAAAAAAAAEDALPAGAPGALVKHVSKLLVDALNQQLAEHSKSAEKSAELFAATIAAHPQRASQFTDLLQLLQACCRRNKLRRFDWSPSSSMLETNVAYTWAHSYATTLTNAADRNHEARLALERARDRVALRTLVQARKDQIELATAAAKAVSSSSSDGAACASSVIPPPLLVEMRLASHLPYARLRTITEQSLCPPLSPEERALSHPSQEPGQHRWKLNYTRPARRASAMHGGGHDDSEVRNIDDPQTDAEKLQQEQESLERAKEEVAAMPAVALDGAPTSAASAASAASASVPAPMSDA